MQHIHLTCGGACLFSQVEALSEQFQAVPEAVSILDYGYMQKSSHTGFIVLEWLDEVDEGFITQLDADSGILDYCVYTVPCFTDDVPFSMMLSKEQPCDDHP